MSFNPELLTLARESRGMTRAELAEAVGVSAGYLSKVENGLVTPSPRYITAMAGSLRYLPSLLTDPRRVTGIDSPCLYHRKRKTLPVKALRLVEAQMHMTRLQIRHLLADLDIETANSMHSLDPDEFGSPEKVAQALRRAWGIGPGPIRNLMQVIEDAGGVVVLADFGHGKLDGLSCWGKAGPPFFYLKTHKAPEIFRFRMFHELGHLTMYFTTLADREGEADRFSAEFLFHADELRGQLQGLDFS